MFMNFLPYCQWLPLLCTYLAATFTGLGLTGYLKPLTDSGENESNFEFIYTKSGDVIPSSIVNKSW
jgi:hypothetical protein